MKKVVLVSGGLDSAVCLAHTVARFGAENVIALNAYYGQKHFKEIGYARRLCVYYGVPFFEVDLSQIFEQSKCSLLSSNAGDVPAGSYFDQLKELGSITTYVPFRNGLMLSVACCYAEMFGADEVYYGAHADDLAGNAYPDCSKEFASSLSTAFFLGTKNKVCVKAPFVNMNKAAVVKYGLSLGVPFKMTWSCYNGGDKPCGKCATCIDRNKAFEENGMVDPLLVDPMEE